MHFPAGTMMKHTFLNFWNNDNPLHVIEKTETATCSAQIDASIQWVTYTCTFANLNVTNSLIQLIFFKKKDEEEDIDLEEFQESQESDRLKVSINSHLFFNALKSLSKLKTGLSTLWLEMKGNSKINSATENIRCLSIWHYNLKNFIFAGVQTQSFRHNDCSCCSDYIRWKRWSGKSYKLLKSLNINTFVLAVLQKSFVSPSKTDNAVNY